MRFILVLVVIFISVCTLSITILDIFRLGYILTHSIQYPLKKKTKRFPVFPGGIKWEQQPETA